MFNALNKQTPLLLVRACHVAIMNCCYWLIQVRHVLLINLAVCDLVGSVLLWMYQNAYQIFPRFTADRPIHCLFIFSVLVAPFVLSLCISAFSLLLLALNQLAAICRPLFATSRLAPRHAVIGWFITLLSYESWPWPLINDEATVMILHAQFLVLQPTIQLVSQRNHVYYCS